MVKNDFFIIINSSKEEFELKNSYTVEKLNLPVYKFYLLNKNGKHTNREEILFYSRIKYGEFINHDFEIGEFLYERQEIDLETYLRFKKITET